MEKIGGLWQAFYSGTVEGISDRIGGNTYGLYTNYASDVNGEYDVAAGCEVGETCNVSGDLKEYIIPAGKYAKFSGKGDITKEVGRLWQQVWATHLDRKYTVDFEEYLPGADMNNCEINIYIALKNVTA